VSRPNRYGFCGGSSPPRHARTQLHGSSGSAPAPESQSNPTMFTSSAVQPAVSDRANSLRSQQGHSARAYAEENFDLDAIATRFEEVLRAASRERAVT
jgi:hypothetical protein